MAIFLNGQTRSKAAAAAMIDGGGISGLWAALGPADAGLEAFLIAQSPCLGGRVTQLGFMFPQHDGVLCRGTPHHGYSRTRLSISPAYIHHNQHPNIEVHTNTRVVGVEGQAGDFTVSPREDPRDIDVERCIDRRCTPPGERKRFLTRPTSAANSGTSSSCRAGTKRRINILWSLLLSLLKQYDSIQRTCNE